MMYADLNGNLEIVVPKHGKFAMSCFSAEMKVSLPNGAVKRIDDCIVGESILVIDKRTKKRKQSQIADIIKAEVNQIIIINGILRITSSHSLYTDNFNPCRAGDLRVGDYVYNIDKELDQIFKLELINEKTLVYNIVLADGDDMCVENFLVASYHQIYGKMAPTSTYDDTFDYSRGEELDLAREKRKKLAEMLKKGQNIVIAPSGQVIHEIDKPSGN